MCYRQAYHHRGGYKSHRRAHHRAAKWQKWAEAMANRSGYPPVNIKEFDDRFELSLFAPGFTKKDFQIKLTNQVLSISVEAKKESKDDVDQSNWRRREFGEGGFNRRFELGDQIDSSDIKAEYKGGVLTLTLAKAEGHETQRRDIDIS